MENRSEIVREWLDTFSPVSEMKENTDALMKEFATIVGVFDREAASSDLIESAFQHIKMTSYSRAWPTAAECYDALRVVKKKGGEEQIIGTQGGDRNKLDGIQLSALEGRVIPTARRWMRLYPGLRQHAMSLLEYWGEELRDDTGKVYTPKGGST